MSEANNTDPAVSEEVQAYLELIESNTTALLKLKPDTAIISFTGIVLEDGTMLQGKMENVRPTDVARAFAKVAASNPVILEAGVAYMCHELFSQGIGSTKAHSLLQRGLAELIGFENGDESE